MLEKDIEKHLVWAVELFGGKAYKFTSPANRGVADRIVCWPDGTTWFVELKKEGGKLSALQHRFAAEMRTLRQNYTVLWSKEDVDQWIAANAVPPVKSYCGGKPNYCTREVTSKVTLKELK